MPQETSKETLAHLQFQMDLLKLTSMPVELTGPSVMAKKEREQQAEQVLEELTATVVKLQGTR